MAELGGLAVCFWCVRVFVDGDLHDHRFCTADCRQEHAEAMRQERENSTAGEGEV